MMVKEALRVSLGNLPPDEQPAFFF